MFNISISIEDVVNDDENENYTRCLMLVFFARLSVLCIFQHLSYIILPSQADYYKLLGFGFGFLGFTNKYVDLR